MCHETIRNGFRLHQILGGKTIKNVQIDPQTNFIHNNPFPLKTWECAMKQSEMASLSNTR